ncbi:hypothetical protein [Glaciihabitans sp. UYNi722]
MADNDPVKAAKKILKKEQKTIAKSQKTHEKLEEARAEKSGDK